MYAAVDIHFTKPIDINGLTAQLPLATPLPHAIAQTVFAPNPAGASTAVYGHVSRWTVYLLLKNGGQRLQLHVECLLAPSSVAELKSELQRTLRTLEDAAKASRQKIDEVGIAIYAEGSNRITAGQYETFRQIMTKRFKDTIIGDVLLSAVPAFVGLYFGLEAKQAGATFLATAAAVLIWFVIEAVGRQKVLVYEDV